MSFNARGRCTAHVQNFSRQVGGKQECSAVGEWSFAEERTAIYENMNFGGLLQNLRYIPFIDLDFILDTVLG